MIQIPSQGEGNRTKETIDPKTNSDAHPYILRRIFYTFILVAVLLAVCFYFDLLSDYDLISMILGFIVCIILQFILLSSYFNEEMQQLQTDQIGVIKEKIKMIFGELNPHQVELKARSKYYRREPNEEDRLFDKSNDYIYQNVMTHLRGKSQFNFNQIISKVKGKWLLLQNKIKLVEDFLANMLKLNESRKLAYLRQKNRIKRIHQTDEHYQWAQFMVSRNERNKNESFNNTSYYSQDSQQFPLKKNEDESIAKGKGSSNKDMTQNQKQSSEPTFPTKGNQEMIESKDIQGIQSNWGYLNVYFLQKIKLLEKEVSDLKERVIQQFQFFAVTVRNQSASLGKNRQKLLEDYKSSELQKANNIRQLEKTASKIVQLSQGLEAKVERGGGEIELILKRQFQLRLLKIQSQNLLIKLSKAQNCCLSFAEQLFRQLQSESHLLEHYLQTFNRKINQYKQVMAGFQQKRAPEIRKLIQETLPPLPIQELALDTNPEDLYSNTLNRRNSEGVFRGHLQQLIKFLEQVEEQHTKMGKALKTWKGQFQRKQGDARGQSKVMGDSSGARLLYFASNINDQKLLHMFQQLNQTEVRTSKKIRVCLQKELNWMRSFEAEKGAPFSQQLRRNYEQFKRKEQQIRKLKKRTVKDNIQAKDQPTPRQYDMIRTRLVETILNYSSRKINNILPDIIAAMAENETAYYRIASQIDTDEAFEIQNQRTTETDDDGKTQKYTAFANYISKTEGQEIIDDFLLRGDSYSLFDKPESQETRIRYLIDLWRDNGQEQGRGRGSRQNQRMNDFFKYEESVPKSLDMLNRILSVLFNQWCNSQHFHDFVKEELLVSLNRKKPDIVQHLKIDYFRIVEKDRGTPPIKNLKVHNTEIYRCMFDLTLNFKGKIAVKIGSRLKIGKRPALEVKLLIKEFECPIRICFTPFSIGKSYASLLDRPKISIQYSVGVGNFFLTKIPFFTQFIKTYAVLKLRKKFLWPKRMTLAVPLAFKSTLELAIQQRNNFEKERERLGKKSK